MTREVFVARLVTVQNGGAPGEYEFARILAAFDALTAENERLRAGAQRLASCEAFACAGVIPDSGIGIEARVRMRYAENIADGAALDDAKANADAYALELHNALMRKSGLHALQMRADGTFMGTPDTP